MILFSLFTIHYSLFTNYIVWNVNPEIIRISSFAIRWYGLLFALSFLIGYFIFTKFLQKEKIPLKIRDVLLTYMFFGVVIGARLGHCLFYEPGYYLNHPWEILKIWEGGLASHGGAIGILIALYIFSIRHRMSYLWVLDRVVIIVALSGAFIRTGNLMNSEIYGFQTNLPWGFIFLRAGETTPHHPTQIYEAFCYLLIFIFLITYYYKKNGKPKEGIIFGIFLITLFSARFFIEFFKEVQVNFEHNLLLDMGQILSIPFIICGIIILLVVTGKK